MWFSIGCELRPRRSLQWKVRLTDSPCALGYDDSTTETIAATPPFRPSVLSSSYLRTAQAHYDEINRTLRSLHFQHEALRIASSSLDFHVLDIQDAFDTISAGAQGELSKQETLLRGLDSDLEIVSRIPVHKEFVSPALRRAMEMGERTRTLGDYVSPQKMKQVADTCQRTHGACCMTF